MKLRDLSGKVRTGNLTTDHASSSHGQPVLVIEGKAYGTFDVIGWQIVKASEKDRKDLQKAGYHLPKEVGG